MEEKYLEEFDNCEHKHFVVYKDRENNGDITYIGVCTHCGLYSELRESREVTA